MDHRYRKFLAVAETGSFSGAAKQLHVTQPAITLAVASLEHALGVKLYRRERAAVTLTDAGRVVAETARKLDAEIELMQTRLQESAPTQRYQVGLIDSIAHLLYSSSRERTLMNSVDVMVDNSRRILRDLTAGNIDLGVITGQPAALGPDVSVRKLKNEEFVFVTAPERASKHVVNRIDDWLATDRDSTSYAHFTSLFVRKHMDVTPVFYSASMELLKDMAIAGKGTALLPRHIIQESLEDGTLVVVKTKRLYRPIWAVTSSRRSVPAAKDFSLQVNQLLSASR